MQLFPKCFILKVPVYISFQSQKNLSYRKNVLFIRHLQKMQNRTKNGFEQKLRFDKGDIKPRNWTCHFLSSMKLLKNISFFDKNLFRPSNLKIYQKLPLRMIEAVFIPKLTGEIPSRSSLNSVVLFRIKKKLSKI